MPNDAQYYGIKSSQYNPTPAGRPTVVVVRYEGKATLTGYGTTGRKYRFPPGVEVAVDIRDRASFRNAPNLREVRFA
jgi:hypothetical protein